MPELLIKEVAELKTSLPVSSTSLLPADSTIMLLMELSDRRIPCLYILKTDRIKKAMDSDRRGASHPE
jgi:hypothetical protein